MLLARPANLQRVPSPLAYIGRRGGVPFVAELAAARVAVVSASYLPGVSSSRAESAATGAAGTGPVRRTQDGFPRVTQTGALRILPPIYLAAARAEPVESGAQRLACIASTYAGLPVASGLESATQRLAITGRSLLAAASASPVESVTVFLGVTGRSLLAAASASTARTARQRLACVASTYSPA